MAILYQKCFLPLSNTPTIWSEWEEETPPPIECPPRNHSVRVRVRVRLEPQTRGRLILILVDINRSCKKDK